MSLHILHSEASDSWGGQEIRTLLDAERLVRRGHRVTILAKAGSPMAARAAQAGHRVVELGSFRPWDGRTLLHLSRLIRRLSVDIVHTHSSADSWAAGLAARISGRCLVRTRHISAPMGRRRAKPVYRLPQAIVATSADIRDALVRLGIPEGRIHVLPSGVDLGRFHPVADPQPARARLGLSGGPVVTMVAMLREEKRADVFLAAAARLRGEWPGAQFLLAGGGSQAQMDALRRQAAALGMAGSTHLLGERQDVPEIIAASDVCVLPSAGNEGTPQAVIQYLAMARPVVATAVGGVPEVIKEGRTGLLVAPNDAEGLAGRVAWLLRHPAEAAAMGEAGRRLVEENFDADRVSERTLEIYERLMREKGTP